MRRQGEQDSIKEGKGFVMMFVENDIACDYTKKYPNRAKKRNTKSEVPKICA
ncbi:hypothetical protein [Helicobacter typhlonius]|uniref:hypothetical protein n=1 Tax=Helicobacter typhlonius TaxID=76936 RepID=UPI002FDFE559